jgi:hypothetical protein
MYAEGQSPAHANDESNCRQTTSASPLFAMATEGESPTKPGGDTWSEDVVGCVQSPFLRWLRKIAEQGEGDTVDPHPPGYS